MNASCRMSLALLTASTVWGQTAALRAPSQAQDAPADLSDRAVRRIRAIQVDPSTLGPQAAKRTQSRLRAGGQRNASSTPLTATSFTLFDDVTLNVNWIAVSQSDDLRAHVWSGAVAGTQSGGAVVVVEGNRISANLTRGDGIMYQIRTRDDGSQWVRELDQKQFPDELPPAPEPVSYAIRAAQSQQELRQAVTPQPSADDGSVVDVMVVYTASARNKAGGPDAMRQLIQLGVAETNQGYANSGVVQRIRLIHTAEVSYVESGDLGKDLDRLQSPSDGFLDDIQRLRDSAAADIVSLWVNGGDACGIAYLLSNPSRPSPDLAYNVTEMGCATGYYSFGHEMGHNMGTSHGRDDGTGPGAFTYSYAFKKLSGNKFRTIMGYNNNCSCPRVNYWSNPQVTYDGAAIGFEPASPTAAANFLTLNNTRQIVAAYRQSVPAGGSGGSGGGNGLPQSPHPYPPNSDQTSSYTLPGNPTSLNVTFDAQTYVEAGYDFLYVLDANNNQIAGSPFTGASLSGKTVTVPGATVRIRLVSDDSTEGFGFLLTSVTGNGLAAGGAGLPKLVVTNLTSPLNAQAGGALPSVRSQIVNQGNAVAAAFRVGFYLAQRLPVTTADKFTGWFCTFANGLSAGQATTCNGDLALPADVAPGRYYFAAIADDLNALQQSDRTGNSRASDSGELTVTGGAPGSLTSPPTGSQLTATTATFRWSQGVGVSKFILAIGTTSGGRDIFYRDMGTSLSADVTALPSNGGSIFATLTSQIGTDARSTVYYFRALNQPSGSDGPKLVVSALTAPTAATPGIAMDGMTVAIANQGAAPTGPFRLGFYFSRTENVTTTSSTFSGTFCNYPEGLAAGATSSCSGQVTVPNTLSSGTWYFAAIGDDLQQLRQTDSSAGTRLADTGPVEVSGRAPATILSPAPDATLTGSSVTLRWNAGSGVDEYFLTVGTTSGGNEIYEANQGQSLSVTINSLPTDGRSLYVRLLSKLGDDWLFSDYRYRAFSSGATGTLPRLVISQLTAPTSGIVGTNLAGTRLAITNSGNANAGPFRIGYYYSRSRNVTTSDVFSGWSCTLAQGLAAGASFTCNGEIGAPTTLTPGVWYLAAIADDRNVITQSDRSANIRVADSGAITFTAASGGGGGALPESRHPYLSDTDLSWTYRYPTGATAIKIAFSAETEVEQDYDFIAIYDGSGKQIPGSPFTGTSLAGTTVTVPGSIVRIRLVSDDSYEYYGFKIVSITESLGVELPESTHPYDNNKDVTWKYTYPGNPLAIQLKFDSRTALEDGYDFIGIYDAGGQPVTGSPFTGTELAGKSVLVPGNIAQIRLVSDETENDWGFAITGVDPVDALPRLAITAFTAPTSGRIGATLTGMRAVATNHGNARAGAFRVGYYWSQSPNVTVDDVYSGWFCTAANGLDPGANFTCSGEFGIPSSLSPGRWYAAAIADDRFAVPQVDRTGAARTNDNGTVLLGVADILRDGTVIPQFGFDVKSDAIGTRGLDAPTEGRTRMAPKTTQQEWDRPPGLSP